MTRPRLRARGAPLLAGLLAVGWSLVPAGAAAATQQAVLGPDSALYAVACPSPTVCYAAGVTITGEPAAPSGLVIATNNGGITWWNRPITVSSNAVTGIACPTVTTCLLADGSSSVIVTVNGGATWSYQPVPDPSSDGSAGYTRIACASPAVCVATGSDDQQKAVVATTANAGGAWTAAYGATGGSGLSCPGDSECLSGGSTYQLGPEGVALLIDRSADGGHSWTQSLEYPDPPVSPVDDSIGSVSCPSTSSCLAVGSAGEFSINGSQPPPPTPVVYATGDGGLTWHPRSLAAAFLGSGPRSVDCPRVADCYTIGQDAAGRATIEASTNSGWVWHAETVPAGVTGLDAITCPTYFRCYAMGSESGPAGTAVAILATTDSGHTWHLQRTP